MQSETKNCQNCKKDFTIEPDDFSFYEKIKVPPPTFCPECRQQRRYAWRNERNLYRRNCDLCKKSIVTMYNPNSPHKVYCSNCWWGDSWDGKDFGQNFDFNRSFFEQWKELQLKIPRLALLSKNSINSEFVNHGTQNKNCYLGVGLTSCENVLHCSYCWDNLKDSSDCNMIIEKGSFLYECIYCNRSYNCQFCLQVNDSIDCLYCFDLKNCSNCFLSSNLRNSQYYFCNKKYTKDEYFKLVDRYNLSLYSLRKKLYNEWIILIESKSIHKFAQIEKSVNISGDFIFNSKNCFYVYEIFSSENSKYSIYVDHIKESMDLYSVGWGTLEFIYESHAIANSSNVLFSHLSYDNSFIEYCDSVHNSNNLLGCIGLKKANYCILNKQYTKEEYLKLKEKIIKYMKETGEYGEFFPVYLSPFGYNETTGQVYMPITKEQAILKGFKWQDEISIIKNKETIPPEKIPDSISEISDSIINEILKCTSCERNFNIINQELELYKKLNVSIPRECYNCRFLKRIALSPKRNLWHRNCMKEGCTNEFETSYAPERPEIIYCEKCYQQEVY